MQGLIVWFRSVCCALSIIYTPSFYVWCISIAAYLLTIGNTNLQKIDGWCCFLLLSLRFMIISVLDQ